MIQLVSTPVAILRVGLGSGYTVGKSALYRHFWFTASSGGHNVGHNAPSSGRFYKPANPVDARNKNSDRGLFLLYTQRLTAVIGSSADVTCARPVISLISASMKMVQ